LKYVEEAHKFYDALYQAGINADMIGVDADFSGYDVVIAPVLYMVKPGVAGKIEAIVNGGGKFITTYFSGIVDENDRVTLGGYLGELRKVLGIWFEEIDALLPSQSNRIVMERALEGLRPSYAASMLCDLIHSEGAEVVAEYGEDFYK